MEYEHTQKAIIPSSHLATGHKSQSCSFVVSPIATSEAYVTMYQCSSPMKIGPQAWLFSD
jgi:hypothetical protein